MVCITYHKLLDILLQFWYDFCEFGYCFRQFLCSFQMFSNFLKYGLICSLKKLVLCYDACFTSDMTAAANRTYGRTCDFSQVIGKFRPGQAVTVPAPGVSL
jgi:hypothetical protein